MANSCHNNDAEYACKRMTSGGVGFHDGVEATKLRGCGAFAIGKGMQGEIWIHLLELGEGALVSHSECVVADSSQRLSDFASC
jgi:hypothetical protein